MNIHVGNLARDVKDEDLMQVFKEFGEVTSASVVKDRYSGDSKGFAFVEMPSGTEGQAAIAGLKGKMLKERTLDVSESRPNTGGKGGSRGGRGNFGGKNRRR